MNSYIVYTYSRLYNTHRGADFAKQEEEQLIKKIN